LLGDHAPCEAAGAGLPGKELAPAVMEEIKEHKHKWYTFGCKDATFLITKSDYATLSFGEKFLLRFHKLICVYCRRFNEQNKKIAALMKAPHKMGDFTLSGEKKEALNQLIRKNSE
ncbi:MAG: hypothetical protein ACXVP0_14370, partial [Bacteroidia bacterium]